MQCCTSVRKPSSRPPTEAPLRQDSSSLCWRRHPLSHVSTCEESTSGKTSVPTVAETKLIPARPLSLLCQETLKWEATNCAWFLGLLALRRPGVSGGLGETSWGLGGISKPAANKEGSCFLWPLLMGPLPPVSSRRGQGSCVSFSDSFSSDLITAGTGHFQKSPFPWVGPTGVMQVESQDLLFPDQQAWKPQ